MPIVRLTDDLKPAFERLMSHAWEQNWSDALAHAIIQWRYYDRPNGDTWIAVVGDQCVGLLDSMPRHHLLDGHLIQVRETADWYCLPQYRIGIGLSLLRKVMDHDDPLFVIGGSASTIELLPKCRFTSAPTAARHYILPITARGLTANLIRQKWWDRERLAKFAPAVSGFFVRQHRAPTRSDIRILGFEAEFPLPMAQTGLVQIMEPWHWQWLTKMPRQLAKPVALGFYVDDTLVGCSVSQLEPSVTGLDGRILHLQYLDPLIGKWMVAATVRFLVESGVEFIRCCVSSPDKFDVIEAVGFILSKHAPMHWYSRQLPIPCSFDAGYLRGDDAMPLQALRGRRLGGSQNAIH